MNTCLILIDLQNDYFPGGSMELAGIEAAAANARLLLDEFRKREQPAIHVQHIAARPGATFFLPETNGARINAAVAPREGETTIVKNYPNSFRDTPLLDLLGKREIQNLVICGAMSHMCIDASVRAAFDLGFTCSVAEDACATKNLTFRDKTIHASDVHASFMAALSGMYAKVLSTETLIKKIT
ncbi:MAG: cysteine hydrolase [Deltaproteobacteria bacterium]|nr:cysteine hydrolase [Deltaproteobacteria bacterium]